MTLHVDPHRAEMSERLREVAGFDLNVYDVGKFSSGPDSGTLKLPLVSTSRPCDAYISNPPPGEVINRKYKDTDGDALMEVYELMGPDMEVALALASGGRDLAKRFGAKFLGPARLAEERAKCTETEGRFKRSYSVHLLVPAIDTWLALCVERGERTLLILRAQFSLFKDGKVPAGAANQLLQALKNLDMPLPRSTPHPADSAAEAAQTLHDDAKSVTIGAKPAAPAEHPRIDVLQLADRILAAGGWSKDGWLYFETATRPDLREAMCNSGGMMAEGTVCKYPMTAAAKQAAATDLEYRKAQLKDCDEVALEKARLTVWDSLMDAPATADALTRRSAIKKAALELNVSAPTLVSAMLAHLMSRGMATLNPADRTYRVLA